MGTRRGLGSSENIAYRLAALFLPVLFFFCSCAPRGGNQPPEPEPPAVTPAESPEGGGGESSPFPAEALAAVLRPGEQPLWFEVSSAAPVEGPPSAGPRHIPSPAEAALAPFTPWPLAPHVAAMLSVGEALYLAVNRDSLLAFLPREGGELGLYRFTGTEYWESYTVGNLLAYDGKPALFFYRDDTFAEPAASPPSPPVLALFSGSGHAGLGPLEIPALADIPFAEGWEADILQSGADGLWYYRGVRRNNGGREIRYFRGGALSRRGEEIGAWTYRNSQAPGVPPGEASAGGLGETGITPLPPLPEQFTYTRTVRLGDLIVAAWEEQEDYNIGAAGFMVVRLP